MHWNVCFQTSATHTHAHTQAIRIVHHQPPYNDTPAMRYTTYTSSGYRRDWLLHRSLGLQTIYQRILGFRLNYRSACRITLYYNARYMCSMNGGHILMGDRYLRDSGIGFMANHTFIHKPHLQFRTDAALQPSSSGSRVWNVGLSWNQYKHHYVYNLSLLINCIENLCSDSRQFFFILIWACQLMDQVDSHWKNKWLRMQFTQNNTQIPCLYFC